MLSKMKFKASCLLYIGIVVVVIVLIFIVLGWVRALAFSAPYLFSYLFTFLVKKYHENPPVNSNFHDYLLDEKPRWFYDPLDSHPSMKMIATRCEFFYVFAVITMLFCWLLPTVGFVLFVVASLWNLYGVIADITTIRAASLFGKYLKSVVCIRILFLIFHIINSIIYSFISLYGWNLQLF